MATRTCGKPTASGGRCQKPIGPAGTCGADHKAPVVVTEVEAANQAALAADPFAGGHTTVGRNASHGTFATGIIRVKQSERAEMIAHRYGLRFSSEHGGLSTGYEVDVAHLTRDQVAGALTRNIHGDVEVHTGGDEVFMVGEYDAVVATAHAATAEMHADTGLRDAVRLEQLRSQWRRAKEMGDRTGMDHLSQAIDQHGRDHLSDHHEDNETLGRAQLQANHEGYSRPDEYRQDRETLPATAKTTGSGSLITQRFPIGTRVEIIPSEGAEPIVGTMQWGTGDYYVGSGSGPVIVMKMTDDDGAKFTVHLDKPSRSGMPDWQIRELAAV